MGPAELGAVLSSLKAAKDLSSAMLDLRDTAAFQTKAIELNATIMATQQVANVALAAQEALINENRQLRDANGKLNDWAQEKERYELFKYSTGTFTRRLKGGKENGEPPHDVCVQCFDQGRKGFLQPLGGGRVRCMACAEELSLEHSQPRQISYTSRSFI